MPSYSLDGPHPLIGTKNQLCIAAQAPIQGNHKWVHVALIVYTAAINSYGYVAKVELWSGKYSTGSRFNVIHLAITQLLVCCLYVKFFAESLKNLHHGKVTNLQSFRALRNKNCPVFVNVYIALAQFWCATALHVANWASYVYQLVIFKDCVQVFQYENTLYIYAHVCNTYRCDSQN